MGILANTVNICHFRVVGAFADDLKLTDLAQPLLAKNAFKPIDEGKEEISLGWVHLDDPKSHSFENHSDCWRDHYLIFSMRRDQRKIPGALLKEHVEKAQDLWLAENPSYSRVPKAKREDLKDMARDRLLAKTLPTPQTFDAVWDTKSGILTFANLSAKTIETFEDLFKRTFEGLRLVAFHPYARAMECLDSDGRALLTLANRASGDNYLELVKENKWLGTDFMLWLLYQTMDGASEYKVDQEGPLFPKEPFIGFINDRVVLTGEGANGPQQITVAGPQDHFSEVKSALQGRKLITEATIHMEASTDEKWYLTLKGELFHFASFTSPAVKVEKDNTVDEQMEREAVFFERMLLLDKGLQLFHSLFSAFLKARLGGDWGFIETDIREWLEA